MDRRLFFQQAFGVGPLALLLFVDRDVFGAECNKPSTTQDCSLPTPPPATQLVPNEARVRMRITAADLGAPSNAAALQKFRDAICLVRNLGPTDVVSWTKYVAQHCIHCAPSNARNIHFDWQFLPWHRCLLYFLERLLRKLANSDELRLPYWNWESSSARTLPAIYAPPDQPLFWANRNLTGPSWPLSDDDVNVQPLLAIPTFRTFGGTAVQGLPTPASFSGPHANVHNAFAPGDMSDLQFSPRDPVFYAHHGNIDRLWSSWVAAGHSNPNFGTSRVYFYDENRKWRYVLLNDLRDTKKLGYEYSTLMRPRVSVSRLRAQTVPREANRAVLSAPMMARAAEPQPDFLVIKNIRNLAQLPADTVRIGIFSGKPAVGTAATTENGFLGMASRVMSGGHNHAEILSAAIEVTGKLQRFESNNQASLDLHIAPLDASHKTTGEAVPLSADQVDVVF